MRIRRITISSKSLALFLPLVFAACTQDPVPTQDAQDNAPSNHTVEKQSDLREKLPFDDRRDFEEQSRGLVAEPDFRRITDGSGNVVWDMGRYDFLLSGEDFDSIHPSLQRQATLNMNFGLYEVVPGLRGDGTRHLLTAHAGGHRRGEEHDHHTQRVRRRPRSQHGGRT